MSAGGDFRLRFRAGEHLVGSWVDSTDSSITELMCGAGFDFLFIDAEHSPLDTAEIMLHMIAATGTGTVPIVRVPWNDPVMIKRVLDVGAAGVLAPMVTNIQEARQAVAACLYPPDGIRGFGPRRPSDYGRRGEEYIKTANSEVIVILQIEHIKAVESIGELVRVPRADGFFIGANDLSASLGLLGKPEHPGVTKAIETVISAVREAGLPVGMQCPSEEPEKMRKWLDRGITFFTIGGTTHFLVSAADSAARQARRLLEDRTVPSATDRNCHSKP